MQQTRPQTRPQPRQFQLKGSQLTRPLPRNFHLVKDATANEKFVKRFSTKHAGLNDAAERAADKTAAQTVVA